MLGADLHTPLGDEERDALVNAAAQKIVARRLECAAVLFLEAHKPLSFIASQSVLVAMPFLAPFVGAQKMADLAKLLAKRENVELLISRIEELAEERPPHPNPLPQGEREQAGHPPAQGEREEPGRSRAQGQKGPEGGT